MRGEYYDALAAQLYQKVSEPDTLQWIEPGCWFVYYQYLRQVKQDLRDADSLLHTSGERTDLLVLVFIHVHGLKHILYPCFSFFFVGDFSQDGLVIQEFI